jgi:hypothetical protein
MTLRILITCGLAFLGVLGCTGSEQGKHSEVRAVTGGTSYSSPERQRQLKATLNKASKFGIQ